jgi:cytochrome c-type biogenesis protein CcmE
MLPGDRLARIVMIVVAIVVAAGLVLSAIASPLVY